MAENAPIDALLSLVKAQLLDVNTAIPGTIVSYADGVASVLPTGKKRFADGDALDYPIIPNVRVCWPSFAGGLAGVKGPVLPGDRCLIIVAQQAVDGTDDRRMFDLQDAYAVMVDLGRSGAGDSGNNVEMSIWYGPGNIQITSDGQIKINAPAGVVITTPSTLNTGTLTTEGMLTYQAGMTGYNSTGGASATITGPLTQTDGPLSSNGIVLDTHVHGGVQTGGGTTGEPQ